MTDLLRGISEAFWPSATELAVFFILIGSLLFILLAFAVGQVLGRRRMVHMRFDPLPQSLQDRIVGYVLNAKG